MFENELDTFAFGHRFANDCCQEGEHKVRPYKGLVRFLFEGEHKVRPTRRITKYLLRYTRKYMIVYLRGEIGVDSGKYIQNDHSLLNQTNRIRDELNKMRPLFLLN